MNVVHVGFHQVLVWLNNCERVYEDACAWRPDSRLSHPGLLKQFFCIHFAMSRSVIGLVNYYWSLSLLKT